MDLDTVLGKFELVSLFRFLWVWLFQNIDLYYIVFWWVV
jgi:hypothetical protein